MSAKYKSPSFLLPNEINTNTNPLNTDGDPATGTGVNSLYSMDFDGSSYIDAGNDTILQFQPTDAFTLSCWFNASSLFPNSIIVSNNEWTGAYRGYNLQLTSAGVLRLTITSSYTPSNNNIQISYSTTINTGSWYHVVITKDTSIANTGLNMYINGSLASVTRSSSGTLSAFTYVSDFNIGGVDNGSQLFNGQIDEVAIFNRVLNTTEIAALYGGTSPNIYPSNLMATNLNPIAYYPLGEQAQNTGYLGNEITNGWQFPNGVLQDYVMDFDGNTGYINAGTEVGNSLGSSVADMTVSLWYKNTTGSNEGLFAIMSSITAGSTDPFAISYSNNSIYVWFGSTYRQYSQTLDSDWHHLAVFKNGTSLAVYIDGSVASLSGQTGSIPATINTANKETFIGLYYNASFTYNGELSNVAIWNSDQTTNKDNIYNNGSPQTSYTVSPQNWWKLNATSVYTPSAPNYTTALDFNNHPTAQGVIYSPTTLPSTSAWSISFWAVREISNQKKWFWSAGSSSNGAGIYSEGGTLRFTGTAAGEISMGTAPFAVGDLFHMVASYDGSTLKVYIDGSEFYSGSVTTNIGNGYIIIGGWNRHGYPTGAINYFYSQNDIMSNFAVWDSALSASQVSTLFNFGTPETNISSSPRNYYKLDNTTTGLNDLGSGNANASISGTGITQVNKSVAVVPSWKIPNALTVPEHNYLNVLKFVSSETDYINVPNNSSLDFGTNTDFTLSMWVKRNLNGGLYSLMFNGDGNGAFWWRFQTDDTLTFFLDYGSTSDNVTTTATITDSNWHHLVAVADRDTALSIYIDGQLSASNTVSSSGSISTTLDLKIGARYTNTQTFSGSISNVAIYNTALSGSNISTIYNNGKPETTIFGSPVSWWKLNSTTITDSAGSNNGTNNGTESEISNVIAGNIPVNGVSTTLPSTALQQSDLQFDSPYSNYSLSFDGTGDYIDCGAISAIPSATQLSVSFWANTDSTSQNQVVFGDNSSSPIFSFEYWGSNNRMYFEYGNNLYAYLTLTSVVTAGSWHNVVLVYNGSGASDTDKIKFYVDGVDKSSSMSYNGTIPASLNASIGNFWIGNGQNYNVPFNGKIDETSIFNYNLSQAQILEIYNNGRPKDLTTFSGTAPISWWRLGENAYFNTGTTPGPEFTVPNSISGAPNGTGSGTITTMISADAPGTYANGIGTNLDIIDRVGDAALSIANSQSYNMIPSDISPYVPQYVGDQIANNFSMTFNGADEFFNTTGLSVAGYSAVSISAWVNFSSMNPAGRIIYENTNSAAYVRIALNITTANKLESELRLTSTGTNYTITGNTTLSTGVNDWYNVVLVYDSGSTYKIYVNGSEDGTATAPTGSFISTASVNSFRIGSGINQNYFNGKIDEVAIWNTALNAGQIYNDIYQPTATGTNQTADIANNPNLPTPVAWYRMGD